MGRQWHSTEPEYEQARVDKADSAPNQQVSPEGLLDGQQLTVNTLMRPNTGDIMDMTTSAPLQCTPPLGHPHYRPTETHTPRTEYSCRWSPQRCVNASGKTSFYWVKNSPFHVLTPVLPSTSAIGRILKSNYWLM